MRCRTITGCLILIYIGFFCLIASASPAFANDLKLPNFDRDINKNGTFFGNAGTLWYSPATDTISADFVLETSWECEPQPEDPTRCIENRPYFKALISVQSAALTFELGDVEIFPEEVQFRNPGSGMPPQNQQKTFSMTISGNGFEAWASPRFNQGNLFRIHVVLNPDHSVPEDDYDNNEATASVPDFVALNGNLLFGPTPTALDGLTDLQEDSFTCGNSSGASGLEDNFALTGAVTWTPSSNSLWNDVSVPLSNLCAEYMINGDGFDLASLDLVSVGQVSGQLGGHDVTINSNTLNPTLGAVPGTATIPLPDGHSFHSEDLDIGGPVARGSATMMLTGVTTGDPPDYNTLVANGEVNPNGDIGYLHAQGLPFSIRAYEVTLNNTGINGAYNRIHHLHRRVYSFGPPFVINRDGPTSNDWRFGDPAPSQTNDSFELLPTGLTVFNIDFAGRSNAVTHYPRTRVSNWQAFSISVFGGQLAKGQAIGNGATYHFDMSTDCAGCQNGGADNSYELTPSIPEGLSSDGAVITRAHQPPINPIDPAWGPYASVPGQNIFQRQGDAGLPGILYFPGLTALGTGGMANGNVSKYLMGMRQAEDYSGVLMPENHYPLDDPTSRRGNHFMAGLTMGPQTYSDQNKQPDDGVGVFLDGTSTDIVFGGALATDFENVASAEGTKYVVRRGGLTGAFNTATPPNPSIYGYPLTLQRFAFTQVNNILDDYTWIDGTISIPGKGGFNIVFESLDLLCSGDVSGGLIAREGRPGDPECTNVPAEDDNNNDFIDENCDESLAAWNAKIDLLTMAFVPDNPNLGFCAAQNRTLEVGNTVDLKALDGPIGMLAKWSPIGEPSNAKITGDTDQVVDRRENMGFDVALDSGIVLKTKSNGLTDGWFAIDGEVGLPFWNRLDVSMRLANEELGTQDQTIVMEKGGTLSGNDDSYSNDDLKYKMKAPDVSSTFEARYEWGATGFDFELPVYYEAGRHSVNVNKPPRFLGHTWSDDLVVLQASAGIDFITQQETKVSFGASADFKALETVSIDLNVDVSDPDSVAEIDAFLYSPLNISGNPVSTLISGIKSGMNQLNKVTDAGLDSFLEQGVTAAMAPISGQFEAAANVIGKVQSVPDQLASVVAEDLQALTEGIINPLSDTLDTAMMDVYNDLPVLFYDIYIYGTPPDISKLEDYATNLEKVKIAIDNAVSRISDISDEVAAAKAHVTALKNDLIGDVDDAQTEIGQLKTDLGNTGLNNCDFDGANPLLGQIKEVISRLQTLRSALDSVNLLGFGQKIGQAAGLDLSSLSAANNAVHTLAQELAGRVNQAQTTLVGPPGLCSNGPFVTQLNQILNTANNFLTMLDAKMGDIETQMSTVEANLHLNLDAVQDQLNAALIDVQGVKSYLGALIGYINEAKESFPNQLPFLVATVAGIQSEMDQTMSAFTGDTYTYQWSYTSHSFVREMANTLRNFIDGAIATAAVPDSNLADLVAIVPHPTPTALRTLIVDEIMNSQAVETLDTLAYQTLGELLSDVNNTGMKVFDQMNFAIQEIIKKFEEKANEALEMASGVVPSMPVAGARMDGYALMVGDELERLHIGAEWAMSGDADESSTTYNAALDVTSWNANNKGANCGVDDPSGLLDAVISSTSLPITIGTSGATIKELYLGFTLDSLVPVGIFGGISLDGELDFQAFQLYDIAFAAGVGELYMYLGASGGALFDNIQLKLAFLVGKTCDTDVLFSLDPQAAQYITFPNNIFAGIYARGSASFPVWDNGCALQLGVGADVGGWLLIGPPFTVGALLGGGAFGKGLCIASLRGQITLRAEKVGFDLDLDSVNLGGRGWGAAGIGFCDPGSWSTLARSRDDDWCGTGDVVFEATYNLDDGFDITNVDASAIH